MPRHRAKREAVMAPAEPERPARTEPELPAARTVSMPSPMRGPRDRVVGVELDRRARCLAQHHAVDLVATRPSVACDAPQ